MHVIQRTKAPESRPFIPVTENWAIPGHRKTRQKRYNAKGEFIGWSKPAPVIDPTEAARVKQAQADAAKIPLPEEAKAFDLATFRPLEGRILLKRPPQITEENGVALPEKLYRSQPYFIVVAVGAGVVECVPGDRAIFYKNHRPKPVRFGHGQNYHIGRVRYLEGIVEDA